MAKLKNYNLKLLLENVDKRVTLEAIVPTITLYNKVEWIVKFKNIYGGNLEKNLSYLSRIALVLDHATGIIQSPDCSHLNNLKTYEIKSFYKNETSEMLSKLLDFINEEMKKINEDITTHAWDRNNEKALIVSQSKDIDVNSLIEKKEIIEHKLQQLAKEVVEKKEREFRRIIKGEEPLSVFGFQKKYNEPLSNFKIKIFIANGEELFVKDISPKFKIEYDGFNDNSLILNLIIKIEDFLNKIKWEEPLFVIGRKTEFDNILVSLFLIQEEIKKLSTES